MKVLEIFWVNNLGGIKKMITIFLYSVHKLKLRHSTISNFMAVTE